jgi:hypothetical protein
MSYLIPREVVELLLHRHHPIRILKCFLYLVWLNRGNKRVMFTKMSNTRPSSYPLLNIAEDGVHGVISLYCLVDSWVWRPWNLFIFLEVLVTLEVSRVDRRCVLSAINAETVGPRGLTSGSAR